MQTLSNMNHSKARTMIVSYTSRIVFQMAMLLLISVCCLKGQEERRSLFVSKNHPWHDVEMKAYELDLNCVGQLEEYNVKKENPIEVNFFNIVVQKRLLFHGMQSNYHKCIDDAFALYPESPLLRCKHAYQLFLFKGGFAEALKIMIPYIQECESYPEICRDLHAIFSFFISNGRVFNEQNAGKDSIYGYLYSLLEAEDFSELHSKIMLLSDYWLLKSKREYNTLYTPMQWETAKASIEGNGGVERALTVWRRLVENVYLGKPDEPAAAMIPTATMPSKAANTEQDDKCCS